MKQQPFSIQYEKFGDVHLAVCYCRNSELHRAACRISVPCCLCAVLPLKRSELLFVIVSMCYQEALPARLVQSRLAGAQFLTSIWNVSSLSASTPLTC
jgi:hypothetical protein